MIVIAPYSRKLPNQENPKNYPHWEKVISMINEPIVQVGVSGEKQLVEDFRTDLSLDQLKDLVNECRTWISVDSFFQHFCWDLGKPGIVIWGQSDPLIFGHPENINLLKDRRYLLQHQFGIWEQASYRDDCWIDPEMVIKNL